MGNLLNLAFNLSYFPKQKINMAVYLVPAHKPCNVGQYQLPEVTNVAFLPVELSLATHFSFHKDHILVKY